MFNLKSVGMAFCCTFIIILSLCSKDNPATVQNKVTISLSNNTDAETLFYLLSRTHASVALELTPSFASPYVEYPPNGGSATINGSFLYDSTRGSSYFYTYLGKMNTSITFNGYCFPIDSFTVSGSSSFSWNYSYNQYTPAANYDYYSYSGNCNVSFLKASGEYVIDSVSYTISENIYNGGVVINNKGKYKISNSKGTFFTDSGSYNWALLPFTPQ